MPILLFVAVFLGLYFWTRSKEKARLGSWDRAHPSYTDSWAADAGIRWELDFGAMTARRVFSSVPEQQVRCHALRRVGISKWEVKLEHESWQQEVAELQAMRQKDNLFVTPDELDAREQELRGGPKWQAMPDELAAKIENDYQLYLSRR